MRGRAAHVDMEEVAMHATRQDCWVVLHGRVLDVTKFLAHHPGGETVILSRGGSDVTKVFDSIHAASGGLDLLKHRRIPEVGTVAGNDDDDPVEAKKEPHLLQAITTTGTAAAGNVRKFCESAFAQLLLNSTYFALVVVSWPILMGASANRM